MLCPFEGAAGTLPPAVGICLTSPDVLSSLFTLISCIEDGAAEAPVASAVPGTCAFLFSSASAVGTGIGAKFLKPPTFQLACGVLKLDGVVENVLPFAPIDGDCWAVSAGDWRRGVAVVEGGLGVRLIDGDKVR